MIMSIRSQTLLKDLWTI